MTAPPTRTVACPRCGVRTLFAPESRWRPFCSERCRVIDLGNWATEAYRVPVAPQEASQDALPDGPDAGSDGGPGPH